MNTIALKDKYEENLEVIEKLKQLIPNASENYKKVIIESIEKVKQENNEVVKKLRNLQYKNISKKDFINLMKQDRKSVEVKEDKKEIEIPENKKEIVVDVNEINDIVTEISEVPYVEEKPTVIYEPKVIRKPKEVTETKENDDVTEVLKAEKATSTELKDAKVVFDGTYKIIYNNGKSVFEREICETILKHQMSEVNTTFNFNIIKVLKDFDEINGSNLYFRYMENNIPVEYNFNSSKIAECNKKDIDNIKKIAVKESDCYRNVSYTDNRRKMKFRKGLVVAAALGLAVLGSFGLKKVRKTADTSASTVNTVQESVVETSEQSTQATTEEVKITTEAPVVTTVIDDKEAEEIVEENKEDIEEIKEENTSLKIGDTYSFESTDLYYASTDNIANGNTMYIHGDYQYKATMISVVYKNQVMELVYNDSINLDELNKICKEKYGDDVKISVNFDLVDTDGNVVTKYVGWVNGEDTQNAVKVLK